MKPPISFYVSGEPKGQPRPRAFARKFGNTWQARVYDAKTAEGWKGLVAAECKKHLPSDFTPFEGPVSLRLSFQIARPKSHFLKSGLRPTAPIYCEKKPDADNFAKAVMDCLTVLGIWRDDAQVCELIVIKKFALDRSVGGVAILISELSP